MKLESLFRAEENKLYRINDNSLVNLDELKRIELPWSKVELEEESYNEELLANLREELKNLENQNIFAILIPVVDKTLETPEQFELFINACNHTARRVKDCVSVIGFELPQEITQQGFAQDSVFQNFIEVLSKKHAQYIYFSKQNNLPSEIISLQ